MICAIETICAEWHLYDLLLYCCSSCTLDCDGAIYYIYHVMDRAGYLNYLLLL